MLRRKIADRLTEWKNDPERKALLLKGARQVGKTFSVDDFARRNYGTYIHINFEENPSYSSMFSGDKDVDSIIRRMSMRFKDAEFVPGDTLIFLDEIQNCPDARVAMKFFTMDGRYDVIGTGSLLGVRYREVSSYPVGYEDSLRMRSLDFEEFLWAMDVDQGTIDEVRRCISEKRPIDGYVMSRFDEYFRWYLITGGMPEAVWTFKRTNHFGRVRNVQKDILRGYLDDITRYAEGADKNRVRASFYSIPGQLSKRNKKFVYADVEGRKDSRYDTYGSSLSWLYDADIIGFCYNLNEPVLPLLANRRMNAFKIYLNDTGLLTALMEDGLAEALLNDDLFVNQGAIMENGIAEMISKSGHDLTYFERRGTLEVDFVANLNGTVAAIEVKSGSNRQAKSLGVVMTRYGVRGIMFERSNIYVDDRGVEHYPLFAAAFMDSIG